MTDYQTEYLLMKMVCGRSIRCMYKHETEWYRAEHERISACVSEAKAWRRRFFIS